MSLQEKIEPSDGGIRNKDKLTLNFGLLTPTRSTALQPKSPFFRPRGITSNTLFPENPQRSSLLQQVANIYVQPQNISLKTNERNTDISFLEQNYSEMNDYIDPFSVASLGSAESRSKINLTTELNSSSKEPLIKPVTKITLDTITSQSHAFYERPVEMIKERQCACKHSEKDPHFDDLTIEENINARDMQSTDKSPRTKTQSFCSTSSLDGSPVISRCSFCDGCSSSSVDAAPTKPVPPLAIDLAEQLRANLNEMLEVGVPTSMEVPRDSTGSPCEAELDRLMSFSNLPPSTHHPYMSTLSSVCGDGPLLHLDQKSLSSDQLIFLLLRVQISRYRALMDDIREQKRMNKSQQKSIACLIQAVVILTKKVGNSKGQWAKLQCDIRKLQKEQMSSKRQLLRLKVSVCLLLLLNLLSYPAVRNRTLAVLQWFGIVRTVKSINRMRKMVAENWRSIPSMLTDFWRIFIFRSQLRMDAR